MVKHRIYITVKGSDLSLRLHDTFNRDLWVYTTSVCYCMLNTINIAVKQNHAKDKRKLVGGYGYLTPCEGHYTRVQMRERQRERMFGHNTRSVSSCSTEGDGAN